MTATKSPAQKAGEGRHHGGARKSFVARFDELDMEVIQGLGATAAWAELRAKRREMKRQGVK